MDHLSRAALADRLTRRAEKAFSKWERIPIEIWPEEVYRLPNGRRFRWAFAPYSLGMYRSIFDPRNIETSFKCYSRGMKSTVILLAMGYVIDQDPRRILCLWPTKGQAEKWSKENLSGELFECTPRLNYLSSTSGQRLSSNTLLHKVYPGGLIDIFGANAPGDMRRSKGSFLYGDEIDAIGTELTDEGDQMAIFNKRGDEYPDTIRVFASYPGVLGFSRIQSRFDEGDGNEWHSTCVLCGGEPFVMTRKMLRYVKDHPETAMLECPRCAGLLNDDQRYQMAHKQGSDNWIPRREFRGKRSFHACSLLWPHEVDRGKYPGGYLQMLAQEEINAERAENPLRAKHTLVNMCDGEPYDPNEENEKPPEWKLLWKRREHYDKVPARALVLTAFVDIQFNRFEIEWKAWAENQESWGLFHEEVDGNPKDKETWQQALTPALRRTFPHELGGTMTLDTCLIDGGWASDFLYEYLRWLSKRTEPGISGKVRASKGFGIHGHPIIDPKYRSVAKNLHGYHIGTWAAKDLVNYRLRMEPDDCGNFPPGFMHFNQNYEEGYFQELCTGLVTIVFEKGREVRKFENEIRAADEGLDLSVGNLAAFRRKPWNFKDAAARLSNTEDQGPAAPAPSAPPRRRHFMDAGRGWRI